MAGAQLQNDKHQTRFIPTKGGRGGGGGVTRTELFKSEEKHACNTDEGECAEEDLEVVAGLAGGCAWAVRAKGYVICCLWGINTSFSVRSFVPSGGEKTRQGRETGQTSPSQNHGSNTTTALHHSNIQTSKAKTNQLFSHQATVPSNLSSAEPQAAHEQPPFPHSTA